MTKQRELSRLSPRDECLARVALANTPQERLCLGPSAVVGPPDGTAIILASDRSGDEETELSCELSSRNGTGAFERDV
ncbi:MAG: hypothetical protein OXC70_05145 [Gammaproteobacteria bacterium]|nr:hypothetical protein [Gammaproteobacteria bacterium]